LSRTAAEKKNCRQRYDTRPFKELSPIHIRPPDGIVEICPYVIAAMTCQCDFQET
jgi:hypothetical protein